MDRMPDVRRIDGRWEINDGSGWRVSTDTEAQSFNRELRLIRSINPRWDGPRGYPVEPRGRYGSGTFTPGGGV